MRNSINREFLLLLFFLSAILIIPGCGSDHKEGAVSTPVGPATAVGTNVCIQCHSNQKDDWLSSGHANLDATPSYSSVGAIGSSVCRNCHDLFDDGLKLASVLTGNFNPRPVNGCETCHGGGSEHYGLGPIADYRLSASANGSAQFNTCTSCHQLPDAGGAPVTPFHSGSDRIITDTHIGTAGNWPGGSGANTKDITGYAVKPKDSESCAVCHNPHKADTTINQQWSASGHADKTAAGPWAHYNWSRTDRNSCQRCHTASGIIAYTAFLKAGGDPTKFQGPLTQDDVWIPEMLQCNGCHSNNKGALRNPGAVTETYADGVVAKFPDISNSNLCMACHVGRESGGSIKARVGDFSNLSFINSHYLTAGATLFTVSGYEYNGRSYDNVAFFQHDKIGVTSATGYNPGTGTQGPCIGCHMTFNLNNQKHRFLPVTEDNGLITQITSTLCAVCHQGQFELTPAELEENKELLHESMEAFNVQLQQSGYFFDECYPYFFTKTGANCSSTFGVKNWLSPGDTDTTGNTTGKNNMGAAFNFNLIEHDPGAFAHNRYYIKRLMYDAIDWLDDNILNGSVNATLDSPLHAGKPYQAGAKAYLLTVTGGRP